MNRMINYKVEYDEDGRLIQRQGNEADNNYNEPEYDEDGRLIQRQGNEADNNYNEPEYDEDGRLIQRQGNEADNNYNEPEYDEDGRLIQRQGNEADNNYNEPEYDEDGRLIQRQGNEADNDYNEAEYDEDNTRSLSIAFGLVEPTRKVVTTTTEWDVKESDMGLFFIYNAKEDLSEQILTVSDSNDNIIWESEIRLLPNDKFNLINIKSKDIYITKQVFKSTDIPKIDDWYSVTINENIDNSFLYLKINNYSEDELCDNAEDFTNLLSTITETQNMTSNFTTINEGLIPEFDPEADGINDNKLLSEDLCMDELMKYWKTDNYLTEDLSEDAFLKNEVIDNYLTEELVDDELSKNKITDNYLTEDLSEDGLSKNEITDDEIVGESCNFKEEIISILSSYIPVNIDHREYSQNTEFGQSIMIEKIGSYYIVLLNGFGIKPTYLLDDDEIYFEFLGKTTSFFEKIEKRICKMYGLSVEEYNQIEKILVVDELDENLEGTLINTTFLKRDQLLSEVVNNQDNIILDLTYNAFTVIFKNESGYITKISNQHLGLANGEQNIPKIASIIRAYPHERFIFTGLFIEDSLYSEVRITKEKYNETSIAKFILSK